MTVVLRAFARPDRDRLAALAAEPGVALWNPFPPGPLGAWAGRSNAGGHGTTHRTWAVADPADDRLLGTVAVFGRGPVPGGSGHEAEVGYRVLAAEAGRGVATAAVSAAVARAAAELGVRRVRLFHAVANPASCRVAAKAGFVLSGELCGLVPYGDGACHREHVHHRAV
ncbi:GNAT family N-acetyltransferase [Nocardioides litoris]|uniref:GNAT family N-acetyltransferase n=1 Tax=Nocardioides litoris TaxID=1926648 RepID=UPI00147737B7|nr:GNAT family protein [Nocardioides litoris]